jgi:hypothetical protein
LKLGVGGICHEALEFTGVDTNPLLELSRLEDVGVTALAPGLGGVGLLEILLVSLHLETEGVIALVTGVKTRGEGIGDGIGVSTALLLVPLTVELVATVLADKKL